MTRSLPFVVTVLASLAVWAAGPPGPIDVAPRQTSMAGTLEENGVAVSRASVPIQVNLYGTDGGVLWTRTQNVTVSKGRFALEVGDSPALPAPLLNGRTAEVEVSAGNPLTRLSRHRVLSVPYALRSGDVITDTRTIMVGGTGAPFPNLAEAWAWLRTKAVHGSVTLQLADNVTHVLPPAGLNLSHPDGRRIKILGNTASPGLVRLNASGHGLIIDDGSTLAQLAGCRIVGGTVTGSAGVRVDANSGLTLGPAVVVESFDFGVEVSRHSNVTLTGVTVTGNGTSRGAGVVSTEASQVVATGVTVSSVQIGVLVANGASARVDTLSVTGARDGVDAVTGSWVELTGTARVTSAQVGLYAFGKSAITAPAGITFTGVTTARSPALNTAGNALSWITE